MLLIRRLSTARGDEGAALVTVIAISVIVAIVSATMVATVTFATSTSAVSRAAVQAQASAEDAVDRTLSQMSSFTKGAETSFPCSIPYEDVTASGTSSATATIKYRVEGGSTFSCPIATSTPVVEAEVVAEATVTLATGNGERTASRTVKQRLAVTDVESGGSVFGYGVFLGSSFTATNTFTVDGGGVHANGDYGCNSSGTIVGPVTATGSVSITNGCKTQGVRAGGTFTCNEGGWVDGDLTTAGSGTSSIENTCKVSGTVTSRGSIRFTETAFRIGGNLISAEGNLQFENDGSSMVAGYGRAGGSITTPNGTQAAIFGGGYTANSPSAAPDAPEVEVMPAITWSTITAAGWAQKSLPLWIKESAEANHAESWATSRNGTTCKTDSASYDLNGTLTSLGEDTIVDARTCDVDFRNITINLTHDLTMVVQSFTMSGSFHVTSSVDGAKFRLIVVGAEGVPTCSTAMPSSYKGSITLKETVLFDSNVDTLLYTNGTVHATNSVTLTGALYTCTLDASVALKITHADTTPPGMEGPDTGLYAFEETARYNL